MSDTPCVKPTIDVISDAPLFDDCDIPAAPPAITDCPDLEISPPTVMDEVNAGGGSGGVITPVVVLDVVGCELLVQRIVYVTETTYDTIGDSFTAWAVAQSCQCDNIWPGMIGYATRQGGNWIVSLQDISPLLIFSLDEDIDAPEMDISVDIAVMNGGVYGASGRTTVVHDQLLRFGCCATGAPGMAYCAPSDDAESRWEVIHITPKARIITFELTEAVSGPGDYTATVVSIHDNDAHYKPEIDDAVTVTATLNWEAVSGAKGIGIRTNDCKYTIFNLDCEA